MKDFPSQEWIDKTCLTGGGRSDGSDESDESV